MVTHTRTMASHRKPLYDWCHLDLRVTEEFYSAKFILAWTVNISMQMQNGRQFADHILKSVFVYDNRGMLMMLPGAPLPIIQYWHDDVIKWKHFPRYWPFVRRIHRSPVNSQQRPATWSFDVFFDPRPNKWLNKQSWGWWSETQSSSLWRHRNVPHIPLHPLDDILFF